MVLTSGGGGWGDPFERDPEMVRWDLTSGGGGWGDPFERDPEMVRWDVIEEFRSRQRTPRRIMASYCRAPISILMKKRPANFAKKCAPSAATPTVASTINMYAQIAAE